ncbi:hypothetical protein ACEZDB_02960 [Streptacidiphilus sp. N1-3]|uniref:Uncharacterized protein n=1 Tax=Streptacidiphilus alkalitolerans TaxID=3342712 RepID=A0ABV6WVI8_9ACTN
MSGEKIKLDAAQTFRIKVALNDLLQAQQLDYSTAKGADLMLVTGALTSSLYSVLQIVEDIAEVTE